MSERLEITKTYKLFIDGKFPRSESGRTVVLTAAPGASNAKKAKPSQSENPNVIAHVCRASRKDLRDAVTAARKALPGWSNATAYLRAQILYRMAEMMEGKREEFARALAASGGSVASAKPAKAGAKAKGAAIQRGGGAEGEVQAAIDRMVCFAGWADKFSQVLGCNNPVAGPFYNFTIPEPTGVVAVVSPDEPGLLGLISLMAPALCAGNTVVALAGEGTPASLAGVLMAEVCATSDVPGGVVNILTGSREELVGSIALHRDIDAVHAGGISAGDAATLRAGVAENMKRVVIREGRGKSKGVDWYDDAECHSPRQIEPLVNMKTIWHPAGA